jgi:hypothetical protein
MSAPITGTMICDAIVRVLSAKTLLARGRADREPPLTGPRIAHFYPKCAARKAAYGRQPAEMTLAVLMPPLRVVAGAVRGTLVTSHTSLASVTKPFEQTIRYHPKIITRREDPSTELEHSSPRSSF